GWGAAAAGRPAAEDDKVGRRAAHELLGLEHEPHAAPADPVHAVQIEPSVARDDDRCPVPGHPVRIIAAPRAPEPEPAPATRDPRGAAATRRARGAAPRRR